MIIWPIYGNLNEILDILGVLINILQEKSNYGHYGMMVFRNNSNIKQVWNGQKLIYGNKCTYTCTLYMYVHVYISQDNASTYVHL